MKVAFIGLGVMGYPMAGHLKKGGYEVTVYNRNPARAQQWKAEYGGHAGRSGQGPGDRVLLRGP
jgi:3-hydroxyisobutyrate dehydrogenase-like beta-hydroxyacid dehydrogenase